MQEQHQRVIDDIRAGKFDKSAEEKSRADRERIDPAVGK